MSKLKNKKQQEGTSHDVPQTPRILYQDEDGRDVPKEKATKYGELYYLNDEHNIVSPDDATEFAITWYDIKTKKFVGDTNGTIIPKSRK